MYGIALLALAIVPQEGGVVVENVAAIERNWVVNREDDLLFTQIIFWEWDGHEFQVRSWKNVNLKRGEYEWIPWALPTEMPVIGKRIVWSDAGVLREVRGDCFSSR